VLKDLRDQLWRSCVFTVIFTVTIGLAYPLLVTLTARACFPHQADGSIILRNGRPVGSELIGQAFRSPRYFWGRPSATAPFPCNAASSSGSNAGPLNPDFLAAVRARAAALRRAGGAKAVPMDLITASGSGLDPHISPAAAAYQAARIARARGLTLDGVKALIERHTEQSLWGFIGAPRVNVLQLNLDLDALPRKSARR
jgi:K+-transporting ATPase ATPase C chain